MVAVPNIRILRLAGWADGGSATIANRAAQPRPIQVQPIKLGIINSLEGVSICLLLAKMTAHRLRHPEAGGYRRQLA